MRWMDRATATICTNLMTPSKFDIYHLIIHV
jgi:hypothetical protein